MTYYLTIYYIYGPQTYLLNDYQVAYSTIFGFKVDGKTITIDYYDADVNGVLITNKNGVILFARNKGLN